MVRDKLVAPQAAAELTLGDWADVIGSGWFGKLAHNFAFARNGVHGPFGQHSEHYVPDGLQKCLQQSIRSSTNDPVDDIEKSLSTTTLVEPLDGVRHSVAQITPRLRMLLRETMRKTMSGSTGCPVARRSALAPRGVVDKSPHIQRMLRSGDFRLEPVKSDATQVRIHQDLTAIDRTLIHFADKLDEYDARYGTPVILPADGKHKARLTHAHKPKTNALHG